MKYITISSTKWKIFTEREKGKKEKGKIFTECEFFQNVVCFEEIKEVFECLN